MPVIKFKLPVPKLSFRSVELSFELKMPQLRFPRIRPARQLYYSVALHVLLLTAGAGLNFLSEHAPRPNIEIEVELAAVPATKEVSLAHTTSAPADTIRVPGKNSAQGMSSLLHQAMTALPTPVSGVSKAAQPASDLSRFAQQIGHGLLADAVAALPDGGRAQLPSGRLERSASVPIQKLIGTGAHPMSAVENKEIRNAIVSHEDDFRACHEKALLVDSTVSGQATLVFGVAALGNVGDARIAFEGAGNGAGKQLLESCLQHEALKLHFPASLVGTEIRFNLVLR